MAPSIPAWWPGAGGPLAIELFRQFGVAATIDLRLLVKQRQRGLHASQLAERPIALWTIGDEHLQDLATLRGDHALATLLGYRLPGATTVRPFPVAFHADDLPLWAAGSQVLTALKRLALPGAFALAQPKRLRFLLFDAAGKAIHHVRRTPLRLPGAVRHALAVRVRDRIDRFASPYRICWHLSATCFSARKVRPTRLMISPALHLEV